MNNRLREGSSTGEDFFCEGRNGTFRSVPLVNPFEMDIVVEDKLPGMRGRQLSRAAMPERGDQQLIVSERRAAYDSIIRRHQADLIRTARRLCGGREDQAQDLVQEAFVRGYKAFMDGRFQPGTNARAWLLRSLTNIFINEYRRTKRWDAQVDLDTLTAEGETGPVEAQADSSERPDEALLNSTLDERLEKALYSRSPDLRTCVTLVDIEGMEYAEAAEALGIPIGTVRSRLSRARFQLHASLYDYAQSRRWL